MSDYPFILDINYKNHNQWIKYVKGGGSGGGSGTLERVGGLPPPTANIYY